MDKNIKPDNRVPEKFRMTPEEEERFLKGLRDMVENLNMKVLAEEERGGEQD